MMSEAEKIIELFKFYTSDRLRSEQTKITKTANSITRDVVDSRLKTLFSYEEIDVLKQAAGILHGLKHKVTHAKEIKQRQEKKQKAHRARCEANQEALVNSLFPETNTLDDKLYVVGLWLALSANFKQHFGRLHCYIPEDRYLENTLKRALDEQHHFTIQSVVNDCKNNIKKQLMENLWLSNESGDIGVIEDLQEQYRSKWQHQRSDAHLAFLSQVDSELNAVAFVDGLKEKITG